jgi:hypothetical protein
MIEASTPVPFPYGILLNIQGYDFLRNVKSDKAMLGLRDIPHIIELLGL